jgi:hypothetical protein
MRPSVRSGNAFLGQPFGGLDSEEGPQYVKDFDLVFIMWNVQGTFPLTSWMLRQIPHPKIKWFYDTDNRLYQVGPPGLRFGIIGELL